MPSLQGKHAKVEIEINILKNKLSFTRRATVQKILHSISNQEYYIEDPHLVCVLSATLEEELKLRHRSRKEDFLSSIEDKVESNNTIQQERLSHFKTQYLDRIKSTK